MPNDIYFADLLMLSAMTAQSHVVVIVRLGFDTAENEPFTVSDTVGSISDAARALCHRLPSRFHSLLRSIASERKAVAK